MPDESSSNPSPTPPFTGLTPEQVEASRREHGANAITPPPETPWWVLYKEQFDDPIIRILMIAAFIALGVGAVEGKYAEGIGILVAIFLATFMSFYNSQKALKEFKLLERESDADPIKVIRGGNPTQIPRRDLVVGDIVVVEVGDKLPADGKVLEALSLQVDEAALTGEPEPVDKTPPAEAGTRETETPEEGAYPTWMVHRGCNVVDGRGVVELTAVGDATEIGRIASAVSEEEPATPLSIQLSNLSRMIGVLAFSIAGMLFVALLLRGFLSGDVPLSSDQWHFVVILCGAALIALFPVWLPVIYDALELVGRPRRIPAWLGLKHGHGQASGGGLRPWLVSLGMAGVIFAAAVGISYVTEFIPTDPDEWLTLAAGEELLKYFMISVTLVVVAIPEGLAMSVVLSLVFTTRRLLRDNNLVKRMHACETIGATTVICTDKTGTLTMSAMRVREVQFPCLDGRQALDGDGGMGDHALLLVEGIAANSTGNLDRGAAGGALPVGNRTDCALLMWLEDQGVDYLPHRLQFEPIYQLRFDARRKYMGTMGVSPHPWGRILHVKGAPEVVLSHCTRVLTPAGEEPIEPHLAQITAALREYEERGMRCLALAFHDAAPEGCISPESLAQDLTWLGFLAIEDPLRVDVPDAISACRNAGIDVMVVTGDNPRTAREIARQLGLWTEEDPPEACLVGDQFKQLDHDQALEAVGTLKVLARAHPGDKERLVRLLQERGEVVAVTGDGVNDVPALHRAQVGLAMGSGTDAARDVSDVVIKDDSFSSIATGVLWGRSLYQNIQRFVQFQLTINVVACVTVLVGPFIGVKLPLTVIQMLWVNLIMDTFAALALASEPPHPRLMERPPRDPRQFIITPAMRRSILGVGLVFILFLVGFLFYLQRDGDLSPRDLTIFFTVFVMLQFWNLFNARTLGVTDSALSRLRSNPWFLVIVLGILTVQVLLVQVGGEVFRTVPLGLVDWLAIIAGTSVVLWCGELWRLWLRLRTGEENTGPTA